MRARLVLADSNQTRVIGENNQFVLNSNRLDIDRIAKFQAVCLITGLWIKRNQLAFRGRNQDPAIGDYRSRIGNAPLLLCRFFEFFQFLHPDNLTGAGLDTGQLGIHANDEQVFTRKRRGLRGANRLLPDTIACTPVNRRNWHITLVYVGDFPERRIPDLQAAAATIDPGEIRVRFDTLSFWQRPKIAALLMRRVPPQLEQLVASLQETLVPFGYAPDPRVYRPHITVTRNARPFEPVRLAQSAETEWSSFELLESVSEAGKTFYRPLLNNF